MSLLLVALLLAVALLVTQGPVPGLILARIIGPATGCEADYRSVRLRTDGSLVIHDLALYVPGLHTEAGRVFFAQRVLVGLDWSGWTSADIRPTTVHVTSPVLRLSQDAQGRLNAGMVRPSTAPASPAVLPSRLPALKITDGLIELGEHTPSGFHLLARLPVEGGIDPVGADSGVYDVHLKEVMPAGVAADSFLRIDGAFDLRSGTGYAALAGLDLRNWTPETIPISLRRQWRRLDFDGKVAGARVEYSPQEGLHGEMILDGVALSLPVPTDRADPDAAPRVRMKNVSGKIALRQIGLAGAPPGLDAQLAGLIEDLPCRITLSTVGLDPESADISCEVLSEGFEMSKTSALRPFAPELVVSRLQQFGGPTAIVDARTKVRRLAGVWSYDGTVLFKEGRAAFEPFPYPFFDLAGRIEFDPTAVKIVSVSGVGLTGARLVATGRIWPPDEGENVSIRVDVTGAAIDEVLAAAIDANARVAEAALWSADLGALRALAAGPRPSAGPFAAILGPERAAELLEGESSWRGGLYTALFSREKHDALARDGLILTPADRVALEARCGELETRLAGVPASASDDLRRSLDDARRRLGAPAFTFGGEIESLVVDVTRNAQTAGHYDTDITLRFKSAGMVPEPFPLPIRADNLFIEVREKTLRFSGKNFAGLGGGAADVSGELDITDPARTARVPRMWIAAHAIPVNDLLIRAIPERLASSPSPDPQSEALLTASAPDILSALRLHGSVDCTADVWQRPDGHAGFDVRVALDGLDAAPVPMFDAPGAGVLLSNLTGTVHVTEQLLEITRLAATVRPAADPGAVPGDLAVSARTEFPDAAQQRPGLLAADIDAVGIDLAWSVEDLVHAISHAAAARLASLRRDHQPQGRVDALVHIEPRAELPDDPLRIRIDVRRSDNVAFNLLGGRIAVANHQGLVGFLVQAGPNATRADLTFDSALGDLTFDGQPAGHLFASGSVGLDHTGKLQPRGRLDLAVTGGRLDSGLTRAVVAAALSPGMRDWMIATDTSGEFTAHFLLAEKADAPGAWSVTGQLTPSSLALTRREIRTFVPTVTGRIEIAESQARFVDLTAATADWIIHADGALDLDAQEQRWRLDLALAGAGSRLEPSLLSLLPPTVAAVVDEAAIRVDGRFDLASGTLSLAGPMGAALTDAAPISRARFAGEIGFDQLSAEVGVSLTHARGTLVVDATLPEGASAADVRLDLTLPALHAAGIPLTDAGAVIATGGREGEVLAPIITGRCAGGSLSGSAWVRDDQPGGPRAFAAKIELAGVRLGDLLATLDTAQLGADVTIPTAERRLDVQRGTITANVAIEGNLGRPQSRRGRGSLVIEGGDVVGVPLMAPVLELSNLIPPVGDRLNYLQGLFYIAGPTVVFEDIRLQSSTVEVLGKGTMLTPSMDLDLTFNSRGRMRVPLWSDLLEGLRNEFITATVTGTLREPVFGSEPFVGTRSLLSGLFGSPEAEPARQAAPVAPLRQAGVPAGD